MALDKVDLTVALGSRMAIVGPSGSGKTTLLRVVAGFDVPDAGRIVLDGQLMADDVSAVPAHRRGIGFVPQDGALFPHLNVGDNIGFGLDRRMNGRAQRIRELADMVELGSKMLNHRPHELSGGQQQRVALARALARRPKFLLLDEPFSALDAGLRDSMRRMVVQALRHANTTTMLVTHDQVEALSFADQVAVLREGKLVYAGTPKDVYFSPSDRVTATFLGDAILLPAYLCDGIAECSIGQIAAKTLGRVGPAEIMVRPEQLQLHPVSRDRLDPSVAPARGYATIADIAFNGATSIVTVSLLGSPGRDLPDQPQMLLIRSTSTDLPPVGALVKIVIRGQAHVFSG